MAAGSDNRQPSKIRLQERGCEPVRQLCASPGLDLDPREPYDRPDNVNGRARLEPPLPGIGGTTPMQHRSKHQGVRVRHARTCPAWQDAALGCRCQPSYEAWVFSVKDGRKLRKTFRNLSEAKGWRADAGSAVRKGMLRSPSRLTLRDAAEAWLKGAEDGSIRNRSGDTYKPSALRSYKASLDNRVLPELGAVRLSALSRVDVQDYADRLLVESLDPTTIRNTLMPLRAIYRRALARGEVTINPTTGVELPAVRGRRDRIASPTEAADLIAALPETDQALWATAMYAGLRRGELMALRWEDVDLTRKLITVSRSWDVKVGVIEPKSHAGQRAVPIASVLREHLITHRLRSGRSEGFVFGRSNDRPFEPVTLSERAGRGWKKAQLHAITLHECRHTFASLMIAAGVNAKALSAYMGHASVMITLDRYGHLMPGNEEEAAGLLDGYLARAAPGVG
jgi:integrase